MMTSVCFMFKLSFSSPRIRGLFLFLFFLSNRAFLLHLMISNCLLLYITYNYCFLLVCLWIDDVCFMHTPIKINNLLLHFFLNQWVNLREKKRRRVLPVIYPPWLHLIHHSLYLLRFFVIYIESLDISVYYKYTITRFEGCVI